MRTMRCASRGASSVSEERTRVARNSSRRGRQVPRESPPAVEAPLEGPDWREWMRDLGRRPRQLREFAGLSQEQLAKLAGVSQGAVSRLEIARGLATPLLIVLKVNAALARVFAGIDPAMLSPEMREALAPQAALVPTGSVLGSKDVPLAEDAQLEALGRLYRESAARHRGGLISVLRAMVVGLRPTALIILIGLLG